MRGHRDLTLLQSSMLAGVYAANHACGGVPAVIPAESAFEPPTANDSGTRAPGPAGNLLYPPCPLVNLAHVCSHLQNASLARLGLTSIPYTKWHLSLALLLQKQGFISSVKLGGPSPPSSSFGLGTADNHYISNHPHKDTGRDPRSPEAALALMLREGKNAKWLQANGFGEEAVEFAKEHGIRSVEELQSHGWHDEVVEFIVQVRRRIEALVDERDMEVVERTKQQRLTDPNAELAWTNMTPEERRHEIEREVLAHLPPAHQAVYSQFRNASVAELERTDFSHRTLSTFAGPHAYRTEADIHREGITITAMGLQIHNQPLTLPHKIYQDSGHLEDEGVVTQQNRASRRLWLGLKYYQSSPVLSKASMVSKPTKRIWLSSQELGKVIRGNRAGQVKPFSQIGEIMAVSTDRGILEARECTERRIGGMALCRVW
ncbi:hypothetical protein MRB53_038358 [Persea americana]|nr:hypothetical protein MRB53_038358 [Persea americana]